jgi:hypothetical protein
MTINVERTELHFWRTTSGFEADFLIGDHTAGDRARVGGRSSRASRIGGGEKDAPVSLRRLEPRRWTTDGVTILPYADFLEGLWAGEWR